MNATTGFGTQLPIEEEQVHTGWLFQRINNVEMRKKGLEKFCHFLISNTRVVTKNSDRQTQMKFNEVEKV